MRIDQRVEQATGQVTIVSIHGRMTRNEGYGMVKERMSELLAAGRRQFVLDLRDVPYMDSSCVGELVSAFLSTRSHGGTLKFGGISDRIQRMLTVAKLDTVFQIFETAEAAVSSFSDA